MFTHIMIPVDLGHLDSLGQALRAAADLASHYGAKVTYVGVTGVQPAKVAHSPEEYARKLEAFVAEQAAAAGIEGAALPVISHDIAVELDTKLLKTADEIGADLIVMATHVPHVFDWGGHGGKVASHAKASVMLVRAH